MKFTSKEQVHAFMDLIDETKGNVYVKSQYGDCYNLKSKLNLYLAVGEVLQNHGDELELYCQLREDEALLLKFFSEWEV